MKNNWLEQGIKSGCVVQLKLISNVSPSDIKTDDYIIANYENTHYSLVSLTDGEVIAIAGSIDCLKSMAEKTCDSNIKLTEKWLNTYNWAIDF